MYARSWKHAPDTRPLTSRYIVAFSIGIVLWVISAFVPAPYNYALWILALAVNVGNVFTRRTSELHALLPPDADHMMERYGIFTLIVLGESFIKTISAGSGISLTATTLLYSFFGIGVVFGLWWLYFDDTEETKIQPTRIATSVWIYAHLPLAAGITAFGVASKKLFVDASSAYTNSHYIVLFCVGMILYALSVAAIDWVSDHGKATMSARVRTLLRLGMAAVLLLLALFGTGLSPLVFIVFAASILSVQVLIEVIDA